MWNLCASAILEWQWPPSQGYLHERGKKKVINFHSMKLLGMLTSVCFFLRGTTKNAVKPGSIYLDTDLQDLQLSDRYQILWKSGQMWEFLTVGWKWKVTEIGTQQENRIDCLEETYKLIRAKESTEFIISHNFSGSWSSNYFLFWHCGAVSAELMSINEIHRLNYSQLIKNTISWKVEG